MIIIGDSNKEKFTERCHQKVFDILPLYVCGEDYS